MKLVILGFVLLFAFNGLNAQKKTILKSTEEELIIDFEFEKSNYNHVIYNQNDYIQFLSNETYLEKGAPGLPYYSFSIQLPTNESARFEILTNEVEISENIAVFPSKGNIKRKELNDSFPPYFGAYYSKDENYPKNQLNPSKPFVFREINGQSFYLYPYQYNPVTRQLKFSKKITVSIRLNSPYKKFKIPNTKFSDQILKNHFLNSTTNQKRTPNQIEDGDLLVLVNEAYVGEIQPLIAWKNQKGIRTKAVTIPTSSHTDLEIKSLIEQEYKSNANLLYVLIVGEHSEIPSHSYGIIDADEHWSDSYYGQMTDDLYPELFVGRITGTNLEIKSIVTKTIDYEKKKTLGNWITTSVGIGSNEGLNEGDNNEADWQHLRKIKSNLESIGYSNVFEFYDGSHGQNDKDGNPLKSDVLSAINQGASLLNYTGHGDKQSFLTTGITNSDIASLQNFDKLPFVVSVACDNGKFIGNKCLSEAWLTANKNNEPTGAIAACGSTILMDWAPPMKTQDEIVTLLGTQSSTKNSLGSLFYNAQITMLEKYGDLGKTTMNTWLFFGDPTLDFNYQLPLQLSFVPQVKKDSKQLTLSVSSANENAQITLSYLDKFISKGMILDGECTINIPDSLLGKNVLITGTKFNHIPSQQNLIIQLPYQIELTKCEGLTIFYNNKIYTNQGYYTDTLKNNNSDSIVYIHVVEYPTFTSYDSITIEKGDSINVDDKFYFSDTILIRKLKTKYGCDSTVNTKITVKNRTTNIKELVLPTIQIFPTLITDLFKITSSKQEFYLIKIFDKNGRITFEATMNEKEITIDIHQFMNGIYFIHLTSNNENHIVKIVKI